jgi:tetratricopeptide (TPR) repeat protein
MAIPMRPTNAPVDRSRPRDRLVWSALVFAVALSVRWLHLWQLQGSPLLELLMGDARSYDSWARQIAGGDWLGSEVFYQAPLYPYFLGILYTFVSDDLLVVRVLQSLLGAGSCVLISLAGWRLFSKPAGIAAGLLLAVYAPAIFADTTLQKSVLVLFLLCLSLWILAGIATRPRPRLGACIALGASIGALVLARENALVFAFVLAPWLLLTSPGAGARRWVPTALFATGLALVLLPVALRNLYVGGELHLTTSQLGPNLFIGNNPIADGTYVPLLPGRGDPRYERSDATEVAERALGRELRPSEVSRFFVGRVLAYVRNDPGDWLALLARKAALAFNAVEIVDTEDLYTHAESSLPLRLLGSGFHFGVLAPLALVGIFLTRSAKSRLLPLYLLIGAYAVSLVAFYVFARYRLPLAVLLLPFAAAGLVRLPAKLRAEGMPGVAVPAAAAALAAVFCNWPIVDREYMRAVTHYNLGNELFAADRPEAAMREYREAIRLHEDHLQAWNNLGVVLASRGDLAGAEQQYEGALRISPSYFDARLNLARTLHESGNSRAAIEHYEHARRLSPERADLHEELGEVYAEIGESELASRSFERARRIQNAQKGATSGS